MKRILCVHQGYELYGSDRMFLLSLIALRNKYKSADITVHLPKQGDLSSRILDENIVNKIIYPTMSVLRKSDIKRGRIECFIHGITGLKDKIKFCNNYDLIYINSIVVLDYLIAARFVKSKVILHIHEIPSKLVKQVFQSLIRFSRARCIFITNAVRYSFEKVKEGFVIENGIKGFKFKERTFEGKLNFLIIGRINSWKGQDLLLEAIGDLKKRKGLNLHLRIVGSVFEDQHFFLERLKDIVKENYLEENVEFIDFVNNPSDLYNWADVVVIPSKKPEPFGLVAIEAMSSGALVIGAKHGGLGEIYKDNVSGIYFKPNDVESLKKAIESVENGTVKCTDIAYNAKVLFAEKYTEKSYIVRFNKVLDSI